jgi:hypothetical protein
MACVEGGEAHPDESVKHEKKAPRVADREVQRSPTVVLLLAQSMYQILYAISRRDKNIVFVAIFPSPQNSVVEIVRKRRCALTSSGIVPTVEHAEWNAVLFPKTMVCGVRILSNNENKRPLG